MNTLTTKIGSYVSAIIRVGRLTVLLILGIATIVPITNSVNLAQSETRSASNADRDDKLAYVSDEGQLMLHDPRDHTDTKLLDEVGSFVIARDGRVAFTRPDEDDRSLYIFDPLTSDATTRNISPDPAQYAYPLAWSPDGHYLAFGSYYLDETDSSYPVSDDQTLYVWDGENIIDLMPDNQLGPAAAFYINWSHDGRLAFTVRHGWSDHDIPSEIYLWDGDTIVNLSQNPDRADGAATLWSQTGQLLFASSRDEEGGIYVWDGVSFTDRSPDVDSFVRIPPEFRPSSATWTDNSLVGFTSNPDPLTGTKNIVMWDPVTQSVVRRFPVSSENAWSSVAEGGRMILSFQLASGVPSYYLDVENLEGQILFSTRTGESSWSADGYLAFCGIEDGISRVLSIWDGNESWVVANVSYRPVKWQNGGAIFSCNNG